MTTLAGPPLWQRIKPHLAVFDLPMLLILFLLSCAGLLVMWSAAFDFPGRFVDHFRNYMIMLGVMFVMANISPQILLRVAVPLYVVGVVLLIGVEAFGIIRKGAQRWLNVGVTVIQPSELMKIALPLMMAWYFNKYESMLKFKDFIVAGIILLIPFALILKQPDLGTGLLILSSGLFVLFFAGFPWRIIIPLTVAAVIGLVTIVVMEDKLCAPDLDWRILHEYQKNRVCTLLDPFNDPLGKGFHTIQAMIAIGSGGIIGKGYMQGTQTHLEFIPERTSDFILAVYSEEFGLIGVLLLIACYIALIFRGLSIAAAAPTAFMRLLAGAMSMIFFVYAFVNMGMVGGILPVVGVPLPFLSYGGTALLTLGVACGILMSIARQKGLVQR
ncbi:rod shape-determining protein RodA [Piscinibacterium candidicorallinum]|jgi:rod shape determining protein RodA|uniref:Peptidoglycan glycosyltransferase MrdB n=1 Tax=Piscinibacterium candidicorallinum TaxID=1793872 RepID=A0ABV7H9E3_9BURK